MLQTFNKERYGEVSRGELDRVKLIRPDCVTDRWKGIQHGELAGVIFEHLEKGGAKVTKESWFLSNQGRALTGSLDLELAGITPPDGTSYSLGLQHSNGGDASLKFAIGARVFVCSNGMVVGDYTVTRRHTTGLNLKDTVGRGIDRFLKEIETVNKDVNVLQERGLTNKDADRILMSAGREGLLPWNRIGEVDKEWREPTFKEFSERNAWSLYNGFTYVARKQPPHTQIGLLNRAREFVLN